jgi:hypothetical protein
VVLAQALSLAFADEFQQPDCFTDAVYFEVGGREIVLVAEEVGMSGTDNPLAIRTGVLMQRDRATHGCCVQTIGGWCARQRNP